jgi:hypothetical protein
MIIISGYDKGDNVKATIDGKPYIFATSERYGGVGIYGVCFPGDDFFTSISRSRKAAKLYNTYAKDITAYIENNPM